MIKIYTIAYNKPEYIKLQKASIESHVKCDYEFIIADNSIDESIKFEISKISNDLNIRKINCYNTIQSVDPISHINAIDYITSDVEDNESFMILDHDVFFISDIDESYYTDYEMVYLNNCRGEINYPWSGMVIFNCVPNRNTISYAPGWIEGERCDTGGSLYYFIKENNIKCKVISHFSYIESGSHLMENIDNKFIHLIAGSGWNKDYDTEYKLNYIKEIIKC